MNAPNGSTVPALFCSFCGKSQHDVKQLVSGSVAFICNGCVELCVEVISESSEISGDAKLLLENRTLKAAMAKLIAKVEIILFAEARRQEPFTEIAISLNACESLIANDSPSTAEILVVPG